MRIIPAFFLFASMLSTVVAQYDSPKSKSPFEKGDFYPLGGIAALADFETDDQKDTGRLVIKEVAEGGIADKGGLRAGDVVIGIGKKSFSKKDVEAVDEMEAAIESAEEKKGKDGKGGVLKIEILRAGKPQSISLTVDYFGPHSKTCPEKCEKCARISKSALDYLKAEQKDSGDCTCTLGGQNGAVVVTSLAGLAWLGDGEKRYADAIEKAAEYVAANAGIEEKMPAPAGGANWNQTNWPLAFSVMFLSELETRSPSAPRKARINQLLTTLFANQERSGGWAHGPGGPNALGYVELEVMSNLALAATGMAKEIGVAAETAKLFDAVEYVKKCTSGGGVAYSTRPGQAGFGDPGRTAGAYWAFRLLRRKESVVAEMASFFERGVKELPDGHASPVMHLWAGGLASALHSPATYKKYWAEHRSYFMASRYDKGSFDARPNAETRQLKSNGDRSVGRCYMTAAYAIVMQAGRDRYRLLDRVK